MEKVELLSELVRRRASAFYTYNKGKRVHKKQVGFHTDDSKSRWVFGGNRTGKTECGAMEAVWWATGTHPYRNIATATDGWVVSQGDERVATLAKRIHAESMRQNLAVLREMGLQRNRSHRNWTFFERNLAGMPINLQRSINNAIAEEYFGFLAKQTPNRAFQLIDQDPAFFLNLDVSSWDTLWMEFERRRLPSAN